MSIELVVSTRQLTKTFSGTEVIRGCSISVEKGTIYGFVGKNGAGKTTIIKILLGLLKPTTGEAAVLGLNPAQNNKPHIVRSRTNCGQDRFYRWRNRGAGNKSFGNQGELSGRTGRLFYADCKWRKSK